MSDYERQFVDRLAAKALIRGLPDRQRRVVCRWYLYGETYREIGAHEGISGGRVGQVMELAERSLRHRANWKPPPKPEPPPKPKPRRFSASVLSSAGPAKPPEGFDPAAFLRHMRALVARRDKRAADDFARERAALDALIDDETPYPPKPKPKAPADILPPPPKPPPKPYVPPPKPYVPPPPKPKPSPTVYPPWVYHQPGPLGAQWSAQRVEPWFDLSKPLSNDGLRQIAEYALRYLVAARRPPQYGLCDVGKKVATLHCARDADAIAGALKRFSDQLPSRALLSARTPDVAYPASTAFAKCEAMALGVTHHGESVSISLTWDELL